MGNLVITAFMAHEDQFMPHGPKAIDGMEYLVILPDKGWFQSMRDAVYDAKAKLGASLKSIRADTGDVLIVSYETMRKVFDLATMNKITRKAIMPEGCLMVPSDNISKESALALLECGGSNLEEIVHTEAICDTQGVSWVIQRMAYHVYLETPVLGWNNFC